MLLSHETKGYKGFWWKLTQEWLFILVVDKKKKTFPNWKFNKKIYASVIKTILIENEFCTNLLNLVKYELDHLKITTVYNDLYLFVKIHQNVTKRVTFVCDVSKVWINAEGCAQKGCMDV